MNGMRRNCLTTSIHELTAPFEWTCDLRLLYSEPVNTVTRRMGNGMDRILPGLFVGSVRDSRDEEQIRENKITHIISIHDNAKRGAYQNVIYMCILASDQPDQSLIQYFPQCNDFIHSARLKGGCVLVHCLAGISRSISVIIAYLMSVTSLTCKDALKCVRAARATANPNPGFLKQLQAFEGRRLREEKRRLFDRYHEDAFCELDDLEVKRLVTLYNSMQMTLRSSRRVAHNSNSSNNRDRPLSSHTGVGHHHASSSSSSSSTGASVAMRNFQLRRANSSNLNCYTSSVCAPAIMSSASSNDRRRSINQLTRGDYESACVTLRRTNSTNLTPDARTKSSDVTLNVHHHHTNSNDVSHLRPSSTPAHSMMGERRRRQLPQCPQAYR